VLLGVPCALLLFGDQPGPQGANFFTLDGVRFALYRALSHSAE